MKKKLDEEETLPVEVKSNLPAINMDTRGFEEETDSSDLLIPRAQLLQPTAEGLRDLQRDYGVSAGDVINNLTKEKLPELFIPIFYFKSYMRFNPRKKEDVGFMPEFAPGKMIWQTRDANDPRVLEQCSFGPNGEPPLALTALNFFCLFTPGQSMPVILSFTKTSYKAGKNLLSLAKLRGGAMFSRKYKLNVVDGNSEKGSYFILHVNPAGDCNEDEFKLAANYFEQFGKKRDVIKTHDEEVGA